MNSYVLVPKEPTLEQKNTGGRYKEQCRLDGTRRTVGGYYRAMVNVIADRGFQVKLKKESGGVLKSTQFFFDFEFEEENDGSITLVIKG